MRTNDQTSTLDIKTNDIRKKRMCSYFLNDGRQRFHDRRLQGIQAWSTFVNVVLTRLKRRLSDYYREMQSLYLQKTIDANRAAAEKSVLTRTSLRAFSWILNFANTGWNTHVPATIFLTSCLVLGSTAGTVFQALYALRICGVALHTKKV